MKRIRKVNVHRVEFHRTMVETAKAFIKHYLLEEFEEDGMTIKLAGAMVEKNVISAGHLVEHLVAKHVGAILHKNKSELGSDMTLLVPVDTNVVESKFSSFTLQTLERETYDSITFYHKISVSLDMKNKIGDLVLVYPMPDGKMYLSRVKEDDWMCERNDSGYVCLTIDSKNWTFFDRVHENSIVIFDKSTNQILR